MTDETGVKVACFLFAIFILTIIISTSKKLLLYFKLIRNGQKTSGTVIDTDSKPITLFSRGGDAPVIEFKTFSEEVIRKIPDNITYSTPSFYQIGEQCEIYYELRNPMNFIVKRTTELLLLLSVFLIMTGFLLVCLLGLFGIVQ